VHDQPGVSENSIEGLVGPGLDIEVGDIDGGVIRENVDGSGVDGGGVMPKSD
jgi:hypothetical protein